MEKKEQMSNKLEMMTLDDKVSELERLEIFVKSIQNEIKSEEKQLEGLRKELSSLRKELEGVNKQIITTATNQNISKDASDSLVNKFNGKGQETVALCKENICFKKKIEEEEKLVEAIGSDWSKHVEIFGAEVQEISDAYFEAVNFYTEHSLEEAFNMVTSNVMNARNDVKIQEEDLTEVQNEMQNDSGSVHSSHEAEIPLEQRRLILKMLEDDCILSENGLKSLRENINKVESQIEEIEKELFMDQHTL